MKFLIFLTIVLIEKCNGQFNQMARPEPVNFPPVGFGFTDPTDDTYDCYNPNDREGACISIYACPALLRVFLNPPKEVEKERFLEKSYCLRGFGRFPFVCCSNEDTFIDGLTTPEPYDPEKKYNDNNTNYDVTNNLLANSVDCINLNNAQYVYGGSPAKINAYGWMALLEYESDNGTYVLNCAGSLISHKYILTAAHCVSGNFLNKNGKLARIRLGDYDSSTEKDCVNGTCIDSAAYINVEKIIIHENYQSTDKNQTNDIALLRLAKYVPYSGNIRPICLPSTIEFEGSSTGDNVIVAGWGKTLTSRKSNMENQVNIAIFDQDACAEKYKNNGITITDKQLCAGGKYAEDTCVEDAGGPIMVEVRAYFILEGIFSFGKGCGVEEWPGIYTRVSKYEDWIKNNIEP